MPVLRPSTPAPAGRAAPRRSGLLAVVPALALGLALGLGITVDQMVGVGLGALALLWLVPRPTVVLRAFVVLLPFHLLVLSGLYAAGVSGGIVQVAGLWKEAAAVALCLAAWEAVRRSPRPADALDRVAGAFVVLGTAYLVAQPVLAGGVGGAVSSTDRLTSWRATVLPVALLLAARHLRLSSAQLGRLVRSATRLAVALGLVALVELVASGWWSSFVVDTLGVNRYRTQVLRVPVQALGSGLTDIRVYGLVGDHRIVRMGGPMLGQLEFSFLLLVLLAVLLERVVRPERAIGAGAAAAVVGVALVLTQTRSSILGAALVALVVLRPRPGRSPRARHRLALVLALLAVVLVPLAVSAGLAGRFTVGDPASDQDHGAQIRHAAEVVAHAPLGHGLGTGALAGSLLKPGAVVAEDQLLDIGVQLGIAGMVLFAGVLLALIVQLGRAGDRAGGPVGATAHGLRSALLGLLVPCWVLQPFLTPEVGWVVFALAGAALGAAEVARPAAAR